MARILLGVSGGIAAYKALEFVRLATGAGHSVRVIQTPTSQRFVGEASFAALTGAPVLTDEFQSDPARGAFPGQPLPEHQPISHLELVSNAELLLIAPASANTIAKLAHGIADNLLLSCALAARCPLLVAPAMNSEMFTHPATQANLELLASRGARIIDPGVGRLASKGEEGVGRLAEPAELLAVCEGACGNHGTWRGVNVLITAGGTREAIDSVRFIGNSSSGRMGVALAQAAARRGARVTLLAANLAVEPPAGITVHTATSAVELQRLSEANFPDCDVLLMAAAVADFRPSTAQAGKIKKDTRNGLTLELEPTVDILRELSARRAPGQTLVGFAAEHGEGALDYARQKLAHKRLDAVVLNDISQPEIGFDSAENEVWVLSAEREHHLHRAPKPKIAEAILDEIELLRSSSH